MREEVTFNGIKFSDYFDVINVDRPNAAVTSETKTVAGRDGAILVGSTLGTVTITVTVMLKDPLSHTRRARMREVWQLLYTDDARPLEFSEDDGLYYMAKLDGEMPVTEHIRSGGININFTAFDPILYGKRNSVTVPSGSSVSFYVDGSYGTYPTISGSVSGSSQTGNLWGIRLDGGDFIHMPMGNTTQKSVEIDCATRVCKVAGAVTLPTMDSDWLCLRAGQHTIVNDVGSGACTVTWDERWR
jgi:predicted phage tail component-like protein